MRTLRIAAVVEKTNLSRATIYRAIRDRGFPAPHKYSKTLSLWDEAAIDAWLARTLGVDQAPPAKGAA